MPFAVTAGEQARADDVNQYKDLVEGADTAQFVLRQASGDNFTIRLATANGSDTVRIENVSGTAVVEMDSLGNITMQGTALIIPNMPTSDPSVAGQLWSSTNDVQISAG